MAYLSVSSQVTTATLQALRSDYERDGFVVVRGLLSREYIFGLRDYVESLGFADVTRGQPHYVQTAFGANGSPKLVKVSGLAESDDRIRELATSENVVSVVEALVGVGARRFRDVLIVKPARTGGALSYHQDSAFWDVEPPSLVSCWVGLGDVTKSASCLSVVPRTHLEPVDHAILMGGRFRLPDTVTSALRKLVSVAGTGDNPKQTGRSLPLWRMKKWVLAETTRHLPVLFDLQDLRIPPEALSGRTEQFLPIDAGDVIFFHSLLWHASGPNESDSTRFAEIVSFMGPDARFVGRGSGAFPLARQS